ncbi:MAG: hypothetical protein JWM71_1139 [Solirubrobacteraceae bacterium]|nr:hypothetical protein [Solirubrobacteraceae bacterium]
MADRGYDVLAGVRSEEAGAVARPMPVDAPVTTIRPLIGRPYATG